MQTLILINPVAAPPRAESLVSDSGTTAASDETFADLLACIEGGLPAMDPIETVAIAVAFGVPPETVLPFRFEPMGAVQGLSGAAVLPEEASEGDLPRRDIPVTGAPLPGVPMAGIISGVVVRPSQSVDLASAAAMGISLPSRLPEDAAHSFPAPENQRLASLNPADLRPSTASDSNLLQLPAIAEGSPPINLNFMDSPPARLAAQAAGPAKSSILAVNMQLPPPTEISAYGASQLADKTGPANADPVENVMASAIAKLAIPSIQTLVPTTVSGAALFWQAGSMAGVAQGERAEQAPGTDLVSAAAEIRGSSTLPSRLESQVAPTFRWGDGLGPAFPALVELVDPDLELEVGAIPASGGLPTHSSTLGGVGHPSAPVSLQELPRLAAQLAGTLVHRADGQTDVALSPEELGHVRLTMQADAQNPDRMVVMLTFERPETLDLFRRHADQLADALREAGFSGADISFGRSGGENAQDGSEPDRPAAEQRETTFFGSDLTPLQTPSKPAATGSLDLRL